MKRKAALFVAALLLFAAAFAAIDARLSYPIDASLSDLPEHIKAFYNRGYKHEYDPSIQLYDRVDLGDRIFYLLEIDLDLGYVSLEQGPTGRYKIARLGYGTGSFRYDILEHDGTNYLLFGGRDVTTQISKISIDLKDSQYDLHVPDGASHFLLCTPLKSNVEDRLIGLDRIRFYDQAGKDITSRYG